MLFFVNTFMWTGAFRERHLPILESLKDWGADGVEIACSDFEKLPTAAIRRQLERTGLGCTLSSSPPAAELSLIHHEPEARRAALAYLRDAVRVAGDLGATLLVGPLYAHVAWFTGARPTPEQFKWAVDGFHALSRDLESAGLCMAIEPMNRFEAFFLPTASEGVRLCEAVASERIGLMLDTAHMVIEEKDLNAAVRTAGGWLFHMQTSENDRGVPGSGRIIDWDALFSTLREIGFDGGCAIESFPFHEAETAARTWCWRDLAASPEDIARDGLTFLKAAHRRALS
jgi:D-psicose/D-tagatose/L-ribulose 3-epimerase